jgi:hypothetical protein
MGMLASLWKGTEMRVVMTLAIHLVWCAIWRSRISRILHVIVAVLLKLLNATGSGLILTRDLRARLVSNRWELDGSALLVTGSWCTIGGGLTIGGDSGSSGTLFFSLALVLLLLLASLPLLSDLLELCYKLCVSVLMLHYMMTEDPC